MRTKIHRSLLLGLMLALCACTSPDKKDSKQSASSAEVPCICGRPEAAVEGCAHPLCLSGKGNPDNQDCVCGPLSLEGKEK